jgi:hypothetical protein
VAETKLEGVVRAPQAVVTHVGDGWGIAASHATADDPVLHLPFDKLPAPTPDPPPPPAPSEAQYRASLAQALAAQVQADEAVSRATEAHERAIALVTKRRTELSSYASLDSDRFARTLDSLRDDDGYQTTPGEDDRLIKREIAKLDLEEAERAETTLLNERAVRASAAGDAAKEVNRLATCVLLHKAEAMADEYNEHLRQAAAIKEALHEFDWFSANSGARSGKVTNILLSSGTAALAKLRDTSSWREARDKLLADPQAEISIATPTPKPALEPMEAARAMAALYSGRSIPAAEYFAEYREKQLTADEAP